MRRPLGSIKSGIAIFLIVALTACSVPKVKPRKFALPALQLSMIYAELITPQFPIVQIEPREELLRQDPLWAGYYYSVEGFEIATNYALVSKEYSDRCINLFWAPTANPITIQQFIDNQWQDLRILPSSVTNWHVRINDLRFYRLKLK